MKIGLVCPYSMARGGGVQEIVRAVRAELVARGHDARIITPQPRDIEGVDTEGIIFVGAATDFRSPLGTTSAVSASIDNEPLEQMLETEQFDVLHFHEPWVPFLSRQILSRSKTVNIATFHAKVPETILSRTVVRSVTPYTKSIMKYLHELTAVSEPAAEYVGTMTEQPITIIPNGIDLAAYRKKAAKQSTSKQQTIVFVGRLERRKGVKYLLQAYALLVEQMDNVQLVIVGDGPDREKLELLCEELELPNVSFMGYVDDKTKKDILNSADLFCAPALYGESFGIVLLEAMALGLVTVAGNNSGYASVMRDMGNISLVTPQDSVEFARRLELLLTEPKLRKLWTDWAKEYVKQFDYPRIVDQYEQLYVDALERHGETIRQSHEASR